MSNWVKVGLQLVPLVIQGINQAEQRFGGGKGREKAEHAIELAGAGLRFAEVVSGRDLVKDEAVQPALRTFIDAYVELQNAVRKAKALAPGAEL